MDDLDALLNQFVRMGTRDHDELVNQFCTIIPSAEADIARFFLEANGWTLQVNNHFFLGIQVAMRNS